ncbi:PepSY domain-containing protein [Sporosarcina cascadiensis]|uniref:PepSY domain-containing protein n=1 Tax=Sporosarcina cascadiensis TaxID=2660747 RepID=UPI00129BD853|nr:PepSY domain-containing protein [Sporosarcina cascadiensis]
MMSWWKKPWMLPLLLAVVIVMGSNWYIKQIMHQDAVPKEEVKSRLESMYQGSVEQLTEGADGYEAEIRRNGALYSATVDHKTGKVLALTLLSEAEPEVAVKPEPEAEKAEPAGDVAPVEKPAAVPLPKSEEQPKPAPAPEPAPKPAEKPVAKPQPKPAPAPAPAPKQSVLLTSQQAANIALRQLNAKVPVEVDDIDFVETQQGGYYLVELELDTDADLDEVVYQIHAISGKVMSVEWDD